MLKKQANVNWRLVKPHFVIMGHFVINSENMITLSFFFVVKMHSDPMLTGHVLNYLLQNAQCNHFFKKITRL